VNRKWRATNAFSLNICQNGFWAVGERVLNQSTSVSSKGAFTGKIVARFVLCSLSHTALACDKLCARLCDPDPLAGVL
jgi:hypothetical protein